MLEVEQLRLDVAHFLKDVPKKRKLPQDIDGWKRYWPFTTKELRVIGVTERFSVASTVAEVYPVGCADRPARLWSVVMHDAGVDGIAGTIPSGEAHRFAALWQPDQPCMISSSLINGAYRPVGHIVGTLEEACEEAFSISLGILSDPQQQLERVENGRKRTSTLPPLSAKI